MYLVKTPVILSKLTSPSLIWNIPNNEKKIYLTFDDGPIPGLSMEILSILSDYNAHATFFLVGENVQRYPQLLQRITDDGHHIGNHSHKHISGWKTPTNEYLKDIQNADNVIKSFFFRPPYGRISYSQIKQLKKKYRIIMWSILSGDFDANISSEQCLFNALQSKEGDIVVFHDNIKSADKIKKVLPKYLETFTKEGYQFCTLPKDL